MFYGKTGSAFEDLPFANIFTPVPRELQNLFSILRQKYPFGTITDPYLQAKAQKWQIPLEKKQLHIPVHLCTSLSSQVVVHSVIVYTAMWPWQGDFFVIYLAVLYVFSWNVILLLLPNYLILL